MSEKIYVYFCNISKFFNRINQFISIPRLRVEIQFCKGQENLETSLDLYLASIELNNKRPIL